MSQQIRWQELRQEHDDARQHYEDVVTDVHAAFEDLVHAKRDELPPEEELARLSEAWGRLEKVRREIDHYFRGDG